jgi:hypothetical protein
MYFVKSPTAMGYRLLLKGMFFAEQKINKSTNTFGGKLTNTRTNSPWHSAVFRYLSIEQDFLLKDKAVNTNFFLVTRLVPHNTSVHFTAKIRRNV